MHECMSVIEYSGGSYFLLVTTGPGRGNIIPSIVH